MTDPTRAAMTAFQIVKLRVDLSRPERYRGSNLLGERERTLLMQKARFFQVWYCTRLAIEDPTGRVVGYGHDVHTILRDHPDWPVFMYAIPGGPRTYEWQRNARSKS